MASTAAVDRLKVKYPGRQTQIDLLNSHLDQQCSAGNPLLVTGPHATGKTSVVGDLLLALNLPHAYINCNYVVKPRTILASILHQLKGAKRKRSEGYECSVKCDNIAQFLLALPSAVYKNHQTTSWIVLDNAHRIAGTELLTALMRIKDVTGANVGLILISPVAWSSGAFSRDTHSIVPPISILFPAYQKDHLIKILELNRASKGQNDHQQQYHQLLIAFVPIFMRASNNILDLQAAVDLIWPKYIQPITEGRDVSAAVLYGRIKDDVQRIVSNLDLTVTPVFVSTTGPSSSDKQHQEQQVLVDTNNNNNKGLALELPFMSKHLLMAAYIASRNKPTSDRAVFDPTHMKRGRKDAHTSDKRAEAALEASLKGPHTFALERLLHIFYCLYVQSGGAGGEADDSEDEDGDEEKERKNTTATVAEVQHAEVMMQLSTLVSLRLMSHATGDVLDGGTYRCNVTDAMAQEVAENIKLRLGDFLRMG